jgi:hypothetical protein
MAIEHKLRSWRREASALRADLDRGGDVTPDMLTRLQLLRADLSDFASGKEFPPVDPVAAKKGRMLRDALTIRPIDLPADAPQEIRKLADNLAGHVWSAALQAQLGSDTQQVLSGLQAKRAEVESLNRRWVEMSSELAVLRDYLRLMDALGKTGAEKKGTV